MPALHQQSLHYLEIDPLRRDARLAVVGAVGNDDLANVVSGYQIRSDLEFHHVREPQLICLSVNRHRSRLSTKYDLAISNQSHARRQLRGLPRTHAVVDGVSEGDRRAVAKLPHRRPTRDCFRVRNCSVRGCLSGDDS